MEENLDLTKLDQIVEEAGEGKRSLIPVLQRAQRVYGYLPPEVLRLIADRLEVALSKVYGVATFYSQFHLTPRGRHIIQQCDGTACHVRGAARIIAAVERGLEIKAGETTPDLKYTYEVVYCLGSCALAPTAMIDDRVARGLTPEKMLDIIKNLD
ncbi:MAG: NADH-quinone oxidoreductase subunit NuoE [Anaerolineae bacterium]|nr:NADH-quinone oxidoreductase subunit NuoE [Anaerolineae bacterium]